MADVNLTALPRHIVIAGPTASGKTAAALAVAQHFKAQGSTAVEIISVDSALVYRGMDIGTAKPSAAELAQAPHHLIDLIEPTQSYSAAEFVADAQRLMAEITARGALPLLVGGTMLYFKALFEGLDELPPADPAVRAALDERARQHGWPALHAELAQVDPVTAARLPPGDSPAHPACARGLAGQRPAACRAGRPAAGARDADAAGCAEPADPVAGAGAIACHAARAHRATPAGRCCAAGLPRRGAAPCARAAISTSRPAVDALRRLPPGLGGCSTTAAACGAGRLARPARHGRHPPARQAADSPGCAAMPAAPGASPATAKSRTPARRSQVQAWCAP